MAPLVRTAMWYDLAPGASTGARGRWPAANGGLGGAERRTVSEFKTLRSRIAKQSERGASASDAVLTKG